MSLLKELSSMHNITEGSAERELENASKLIMQAIDLYERMQKILSKSSITGKLYVKAGGDEKALEHIEKTLKDLGEYVYDLPRSLPNDYDEN